MEFDLIGQYFSAIAIAAYLLKSHWNVFGEFIVLQHKPLLLGEYKHMEVINIVLL